MFSFVPLQRSDYPLLSEWLRQPHVAAWWADDPDLAALELQYGDCIDGKEACHGFLACYDQEPIGLVQYFLLAAYPEYAAEIVEHVWKAFVENWSLGKNRHRANGLYSKALFASSY